MSRSMIKKIKHKVHQGHKGKHYLKLNKSRFRWLLIQRDGQEVRGQDQKLNTKDTKDSTKIVPPKITAGGQVTRTKTVKVTYARVENHE